jgi:hypothetical protein
LRTWEETPYFISHILYHQTFEIASITGNKNDSGLFGKYTTTWPELIKINNTTFQTSFPTPHFGGGCNEQNQESMLVIFGVW